MKIVFMGTPEFALPTLEKLVTSEHSVIASSLALLTKTFKQFCFEKKLFERLCEERQRRSNPEDLDWIAAPPVATRDDRRNV